MNHLNNFLQIQLFKFSYISPATLTIKERDRNECTTTQAIEDFFMHTYTQEMAKGVPDILVFNADEILVEIGIPTKVLVPPNNKRGPNINDFDQNSHITAMVTLNAAGDLFPPFLIFSLTYLPKKLSLIVLRCQMNVSSVMYQKWIYDK